MNDQAMRAKAQTSQFEEILDALKKAASGDYSVKLNTTSENNELSQIALAVNDLLKSAHDRISKVLAAAENSAKNAERYRHILDNIEEGYFEVDLKGNLLFFNETSIRYLGYTQDEARGINFKNLTDETNAQKVYEAFHEVFVTGKPVKGFDWQILKKNGEPISVEASVSLLRDEAGQPCGFRGIVRDVSERLRSQKELKQTKERYQTILDITAEAYLEEDLAGRITFANDTACRMFGMPREELVGKSYRELVTPDIADNFQEIFANIYKSRNPARLTDFDIVRPDGSVVTFEINATLKYNHEGIPTGFRIMMSDSTAKKMAEEHRRKSEKKYHNILEIMGEGYIETDTNGVISYLNDTACSLIGYPREELVGKRFVECYPSSAASLSHRIYEDIYKTGRPRFLMDYEVKARDGSVRIHQQNVALLTDEAGRPEGFRIIIRDVTQYKKAQEALRETETKYRHMLETIDDTYLETDLAGNLVFFNDSLCRVLGYKREELQNAGYKMISPPENVAKIFHDFNEIFKTGKTRHFREHQLIAKNGSVIYMDMNISLLYAKDGTPSGFCCFGSDVTEMTLANRKIAENERRLRAIADNVRDIIWTMDFDLHWTYLSPAVFHMTGFTPEEIAGMPLKMIAPPSVQQMVRERLQKEMEGRSSPAPPEQLKPLTFEIALWHKNGTRIWTEVSVNFNRDENGRPFEIVGVTRDITERKKAEEVRKKLEAQLTQAQKMEVIGRLAGGVAHDFNNMLSVILGYVDLAKLRLVRQHPVLKDIAEIEKAALRSRDITTQLLAFSRKQIVEPKVIDLDELIGHSQKAMIRLIGEDIRLEVIRPSKLWPVKTDPSHMEQILMNLAVNARDAMPGGGKLIIQTENIELDKSDYTSHAVTAPGKYVRLTVSDNGTGIDKETINYIFEPFFTTKEAGKGTGLGLATVYGIVKQNDGFINVYSEPGKGTSFTIYLPRAQGEKDPPVEQVIEPGPSGTGCILLTEDDATVLRIAQKMLKSIGYTVIPASSPEEAISLCQDSQLHIDLVLTDIIMPGMNGDELVKRIRQIRPGMKALYMSGYAYDVIASRGILKDGVMFIQKPFTMKTIGEKVAQAMEANE